MDGFKNFLNEFLQRKLSVTLSLAILGVALVAGIFSFLSAFNEAYELQDDVLRQVAALMDRQHLAPDVLAGRGSREGNEESRVIVQRLGDARQAPLGVDDGGPLPLPKSLPNGLQTLRAAGETFRVLVRTTATGEQIAVAQETGFRNQIARASALRTVMPFLVLVPILLIIIPDLVRKMFRRVALLAREIDDRTEHGLHPLEESHIPAEVRPFVAAINRLLARVARSMEAQRRFVADAAHELRTPLTALSLQAELVSEAEMSDAARERLGVLRTGYRARSEFAESTFDICQDTVRCRNAEITDLRSSGLSPGPRGPYAIGGRETNRHRRRRPARRIGVGKRDGPDHRG